MKGPGGRALRRLADLAIRPPDDAYRPPPRSECDVCRDDTDLSDTDLLVAKYWVFRGLIVHFSVNQSTRVNGKSINIARIDTCRGRIHRHQYDQLGVDLLDHELIRVIPLGGYDVVNEGYVAALEVMHNDWEANLGRWRGDSQ